MKIQITDLQVQKISDILVVIGEVLFATIIVPFFFKVDRVDLNVLLLGWILTITSWTAAIILVGKSHDYR